VVELDAHQGPPSTRSDFYATADHPSRRSSRGQQSGTCDARHARFGRRALAVVGTFGLCRLPHRADRHRFLISQLGLHHAVAVPAILCAGIVALAATMPSNDADLNQTLMGP
jgi:hypothetical protein